jgi:hypothetical protein
VRELHYQRAGRLAWAERAEPELVEPTEALVRPFIVGGCDVAGFVVCRVLQVQ